MLSQPVLSNRDANLEGLFDYVQSPLQIALAFSWNISRFLKDTV